MNHNTDKIKPLSEMTNDVRSGDLVNIFFEHTKVSGYIEPNYPWGQYQRDFLKKGDDFRICLQTPEGDSGNINLKMSKYGINTKDSTFLGYTVLGYSIQRKQWDYLIDTPLPRSAVHIDFFSDKINGETIDKKLVKGEVFHDNCTKVLGVITYSDISKKFIEDAYMIMAALVEEQDGPGSLKIHEHTYNVKKIIVPKNNIRFNQESIEKILKKEIILDTEVINDKFRFLAI